MYIYNIQHTYCNCVRVSQFKTLFCSQKATSQQKRCEKRKLEAASTIAPWVFFPNRNLLFWLIHRLQHRFPGLQHGYHLLVGDKPSWCHGGAMVVPWWCHDERVGFYRISPNGPVGSSVSHFSIAAWEANPSWCQTVASRCCCMGYWWLLGHEKLQTIAYVNVLFNCVNQSTVSSVYIYIYVVYVYINICILICIYIYVLWYMWHM